jgi:hypothetical protein
MLCTENQLFFRQYVLGKKIGGKVAQVTPCREFFPGPPGSDFVSVTKNISPRTPLVRFWLRAR